MCIFYLLLNFFELRFSAGGLIFMNMHQLYIKGTISCLSLYVIALLISSRI